MTDKKKVDALLSAYETFKQRLTELGSRRDALITEAQKRLDNSKLEDVMKRIKSF